jgi:hypothetical protein
MKRFVMLLMIVLAMVAQMGLAVSAHARPFVPPPVTEEMCERAGGTVIAADSEATSFICRGGVLGDRGIADESGK